MQGSYFYLRKPQKNLLHQMNINYNRWKTLFLFGLGLSTGAAFCMKWMEPDLWANGEKFTILGLELFYPKEVITGIVDSLDHRTKTILQYHLYFDFAFMAGVYPAITSLCMMAREKLKSSWLTKIIYIMAFLQLAAWACDIAENLYLLAWIRKPVIGNEFGLYHFLVATKWVIAFAGLLLALPIVVRRRKGKTF